MKELWNRFFDLFSKMWKIRVIYKADKMGDRADSWSTPTSVLKKGKTKFFHIYHVFLSIK